MNRRQLDVGTRLPLAILVVTVFAALTGCSGGTDSLSDVELSAEMNRICKENGAAFDAIGHPESFDEIVERTPQMIEVFDATLVKLAGLDAGADQSDALAEFVTLGEDQSDLMGRLVTAAANGGTGFDDVVADMGVVAERSTALATELGAPECAG